MKLHPKPWRRAADSQGAWIEDASGVRIATPGIGDLADDLADTIITAVNCHEDLLAACKEFIEDVHIAVNNGNDPSIEDVADVLDWPDMVETYKKIRAAIAKAEEQSK